MEEEAIFKLIPWPYSISRCYLDKRQLVINWIDNDDGGRKCFAAFSIIRPPSKPFQLKLNAELNIRDALKFDCKNGLIVCAMENRCIG